MRLACAGVSLPCQMGRGLGWLLDLARLGESALVDQVGDGALALVGRVKIDQRGPGRRVPIGLSARGG